MCKELFSAKGIIYKITCLTNDKSYVGQTGKDLSFFDRYSIKTSLADKTQLELFSYLKERCQKLYSSGKLVGSFKLAADLVKDLIAHSPEEFEVSILAKNIENEERDLMELEAIKKYECLEKGYNSVNCNSARNANVIAYSLIDLRTMKKIEGTNITHFCKELIKKESVSSKNLEEKMRNFFSNIPKIARKNRRNGILIKERWHWVGSIKNLSYFGYASSWWLENGVPEHMEIVPHEYDTDLGKITRPLLKVKVDFIEKQKRRKLQKYHFSKEKKDALKQEFTDKIMQSAILYAEKLTEEFKYVLDAPFGPGGITSYLNKKIKPLPQNLASRSFWK